MTRGASGTARASCSGMGNGKHLLKPSIDEQANDADFKWHTRRRCTGLLLVNYMSINIPNWKLPRAQPYLKLWKSVPCKKSGVLEIVVIEQDAESRRVRQDPQVTAGRSQG